MKVLVGVKRVVDAYVKIRVRSDGSGVDTANTKMAMNPFDEVAVEAAVRLKEAAVADEVLVVSIGPESAQEQLRTALAMGADRAMLATAEAGIEPLAVAQTLAAICEREKPDLVLLGKQAIDDDCNQTGQMLAALRGCAQATAASALNITADGIEVTREIDGGLEELALTRPAVVTVDLRLHDPRYPKLPAIMKAKKQPIESIDLSELGVDARQRLTVLEVTEPPARAPGTRVASVSELLEKLKAPLGGAA
ncbi:MAG: electron transfer flavoprotein subunit beta/FixA family protein [Spiribacter salinus]|uniref:Electron transfer flavoprotein subunit beta n=1 Tax=Spiribacter salinus TaxID=1335746 RepID=A0A540VU70_9GAMM|nr:MAG: electron transfer flavoprotein subunit beta/FixA family protein [Spiribacter salinus]